MSLETFFTELFRYLAVAIYTTILHLIILLGPGLVIGLLMHYLSRAMERQLARLIGIKPYLLIFSLIGTAVHEMGHIIFCWIFGHRVTEAIFFNFDLNDPKRGYIRHLYNRNSYYQQVGNFFIGIGPILLGTAVIYAVTYWLIGPIIAEPISKMALPINAFDSWETITNFFANVGSGFSTIISILLSSRALASWQLYLLLYLIINVGSSVTLSPPDIRSALQGFTLFSTLLFVFNLATLWLGAFTSTFFLELADLYQGFYGVMLFALLINGTLFLIVWLVNQVRTAF